MSATELYRPPNGTTGIIFMEVFCDRCKRDAAYRNGTGDSCPIVAATFMYNIDEPEYPKEWVRDVDSDVCLIGGNGARCTAFEAEHGGTP